MLSGIYDMFQHWANQTVWIYSDPHFGDKDLECGVRNRPSAEEQVRRINAKCGRKDTLIILGDVGDVEYVRQLRAAHKVLIMGNHDAGASNYRREVWTFTFIQEQYTREEVRDMLLAKYPGYGISIEPEYTSPHPYWVAKVDNRLFDEVYEGTLIVGEKLILSHEPVEIPWLYNIHGHDHAGHKRANHLNVCSDVIGYEPVNLTQLLKTGLMSRIETIHRMTIDKATEKKKKRGGRKINEK